MSRIGGRVSLIDNLSQLANKIKTEISSVLNKPFTIAQASVKKQLVEILEKKLMASAELQSLLNGRLRYELGIENPAPIISAIVDSLKNGVQVTFSGIDRNLKMNMSILVLAPDYINKLLLIPGTSYVSTTNASAFGPTGRRVQGFYRQRPLSAGTDNAIPWLNWLLTAGPYLLVAGYNVKFGSFPGGRTGGALMRQTTSVGWSIPTQHAGTSEDNFITRALLGMEQEVENVLKQNILTQSNIKIR